MTDSLNEGQTFAADYSLLHRIVEDDRIDCWLAVQNDTNERVFIKVLKQPLDAEKRNLITRTIEKQRGLVHTQIARTYQFGDFDGHDYLISQHVRSNHDGSSHFDYNGSFNSLWPVLSQVADVLIYTHSLGFAHGHLFPDNILIDADGKPHLGDFGLGLTGNDQLSVYLSPQIKTGHPADATDDIYSLGQLKA